MAFSSKAGECSWAGAGGASSASEGALAAGPHSSTRSQPGMALQRETYFEFETQKSICDVFVSGQKPLFAALADPPAGLSPGKYKLVACELATTGRRLVDEICIMAAYTRPECSFLQYIMPHRDLTADARRRHNIYITVPPTGYHKILRNNTTRKVVKSKTEFGALQEFMVWLSSLKKDDEKIIIFYHDPRRLTPIKIMQSILRFNLLDRFVSIVAGFSDSYALCHDQCGTSLKSVSVESLAAVLLDEGSQNTDSIIERAMAIYNILEQLASQGGELHDEAVGGVGYERRGVESEMLRLACAFGRPVHTELEAFSNLQELIARQDTFRVAFAPLLKCSKMERRRLFLLRRVLAEAGLLFDQVKDAWHNGKRSGLLYLFSPLEQVIKDEEILRLVSIFVSYFDSPQNETSARTNQRNKETEEQDELYFNSDLEGNSDGGRDSPCSPGGPGGFLTAEDYLEF